MDRTFKAVMLHGFLGSSRDWMLVVAALEERGIKTDVFAPDFFQPGPLSAAHSFKEWTANLLSAVNERFGDEKVHLFGYSLGGRLALHAALADPERWERLWFVSSNPGILNGPPQERKAWEAQWAQRFLNLPWAEVLAEWNRGEVFFGSTPRFQPKEGLLDRKLLAASFSNWSLTDHLFSVESLKRLPETVEWWFGEHDQKFLSVKAELERQNIKGRYKVVKDAGHRVTLDQPEVVAAAIAEMMGKQK